MSHDFYLTVFNLLIFCFRGDNLCLYYLSKIYNNSNGWYIKGKNNNKSYNILCIEKDFKSNNNDKNFNILYIEKNLKKDNNFDKMEIGDNIYQNKFLIHIIDYMLDN